MPAVNRITACMFATVHKEMSARTNTLGPSEADLPPDVTRLALGGTG